MHFLSFNPACNVRIFCVQTGTWSRSRVKLYVRPSTNLRRSVHCGISLPVPVEGTTNELYVTFTTDYSVTDTGFVATYAAKDMVEVDGDESRSLSVIFH